MPKRTTTIQKVVALVERLLNADGRVRESVMVEDRVSGLRREVDVVVEQRAGPRCLMTCIEVREHRRPVDVTWVEAMWGKHQTLPTHKLVLASASGFTANARAKAKVLGIDVIQVDQEEELKAGLAVRDVRHAQLNLRVPDVQAYLVGGERHPIPLNSAIQGQPGQLFPVRDFVEEIKHRREHEELLDRIGAGKDTVLTVRKDIPGGGYVNIDGVGNVRVEALEVDITYRTVSAPVILSAGRYLGSSFVYGRTDEGLTFVLPKSGERGMLEWGDLRLTLHQEATPDGAGLSEASASLDSDGE